MLGTGREFVGRESEVDRIAGALTCAGATLLVTGAPRLGKSAALQRAAEAARRRGAAVAVASLATASAPAEAAQRLVSALRLELGRAGTTSFERILRSVSRPALSGDQPLLPGLPLPAPELPRAADPDIMSRLLRATDDEFTAQGRTLGIALDDVRDPDGAVSGGSYRSLGLVLVGSETSLAEGGERLALGPLSAQLLAAWITEQGTRTGVTIPGEAARLIVRLTYPRTRDVVQLARAVWFERCTRGATDPQLLVAEAFERTVIEQGALYDVLWNRLDEREQAVLRAFATDAAVQITAAHALRRFRLGPKSSVFSTVERLVAAGCLVRLGTGRYAFDDPYFRRYVQVFGLPDIGEPPPPLLPGPGGHAWARVAR
jgi:hypothetical protein